MTSTTPTDPQNNVTEAASTVSPFAASYRDLVAKGYSVVPIAPGSKRPSAERWPEYAHAPADDALLRAWARRPHAGIEIVLGFPVGEHIVMALDFNSKDPIELEKLLSSVPDAPMIKLGAKGETRFYRADPSLETRHYKIGNRGILDLLAKGSQTVVPGSIHPDTLRPYVWLKGSVDATALPIFSQDDLEGLEDTLNALGWARAATEAKQTPKAAHQAATADDDNDDDENPALTELFRELNTSAMADFEKWVPFLGLYDLTRKPNGFDAVPDWRPSSAGRPLEQRKRNLSIHVDGIVDFGDGPKGYSPFGLTMAACGMSRDDAFRWLSEKTGIKDVWDAGWAPFAAMLERTKAKQEARRAAEKRAARWRIFKPSADPLAIPLRQWLYGKLLIAGEVSMTVSPGGVGKTALGLAEALALASGWPLFGIPIKSPARCAFWSGEEPMHELERRLTAACKYYGLTDSDLGGRLILANEDTMPLIVAKQERNGAVVQWPLVNDLVADLKAQEIEAFWCDPYISTHLCSENDTGQMHTVASLWKDVAKQANCAIPLSHHTRKEGAGLITADSGRGSGSSQAKVRNVRALNWLGKKDAEVMDVSPTEAMSIFYASAAFGKVNMNPRGGNVQWFKNVNVPLFNDPDDPNAPGDEVGVATPWTPPEVVRLQLDPGKVSMLQRRLGSSQWLASHLSDEHPAWIGILLAEVFGLPAAGDWQRKAKAVWQRLLAEGKVHAVNEYYPPARGKRSIAKPGMGGNDDDGGMDDDEADETDETEKEADEAPPYADAEEAGGAPGGVRWPG